MQLIAIVLSLFVGMVAAQAQTAGPQGAEQAEMREQVWRVPSADSATLMLTTVFRPPGEARAPLAIMNHGAVDTGRPSAPRQRHTNFASFLVSRGYVVAVPQRQGYGATGGRFPEAMGPCANPGYVEMGLATAADIRAALDYLRRQPFVAPDRSIVAGHSAGGWGTLALASTNPPGVAGYINFAGGRGGRNPDTQRGVDQHGNCSSSQLVAAAGKYGATARQPSVWIYAANDLYFRPALAEQMFAAYTAAGAPATYKPVAALGSDGHTLVTRPEGRPLWQPVVAAFVDGLK